MKDEAAALTGFVEEWSRRTGESPAKAVELIYKDLRRLAASYLRGERPDHTLQATALVHEAYMRVFMGAEFRWDDRTHVFCTMARAMRQVLIDYSRRHKSGKRGGGGAKVLLEDALAAIESNADEAAALHQAIARLEELNERQARVVELRYLVGLTVEEAGEVLGVSKETVKLDWRFAKAWLQKELEGSSHGSAGEAQTAE